MLTATRRSAWKSAYDISIDGRVITTWDRQKWWKSGGQFELDNRTYVVESNVWGSKYTLCDAIGAELGVAERVGRRDWTVRAGGQVYTFRKRSMWRRDEDLLVDGQPVGSIRPASAWKGGAIAELPGVPPALQVFIVGVVLTTWDNAAAAAAS